MDADIDDADQHNVAIVIGDANDKEMRSVARRCPHTPVLLAMSAQADAKLPEALADRPAWRLDFPVRRAQLSQLLHRAARYDGVERRQTITGRSRAIRKVRRSIEQVADFDTTVLVSGESGTGKELVARMIHDRSERQGRPFVPINCGAIPADLLESELFGHEKGAFTGAISARTGRFALAEGGTLFLDEIGDMSLPMQVKLLRVLQERCFETVGSNKSRKCNVRIVAATHRDLREMVAQGEFREDLYFRLNVFPIEMPPLCKRASDLPQLLDELLLQHGTNGDRQLRVSPGALRALAAYSWPGNIRELSNLVERLAIMKPEGIIETADLPEKYVADLPPEMPQDDSAGGSADCGEDLKGYLQSVE
ncbi:MAG: sigma-54 dependent transcriptional regulator, partial [Gammaproteobacteria bacterium]|nr:sigma-54 dependent transcriptional regulator [Gammaproteobacteria bacterium]